MIICHSGKKAHEIQDLMKLFQGADKLDSIRGYEGRGTALYFEASHVDLLRTWGSPGSGFHSRSRLSWVRTDLI
jgi:hypothetical protein